MSKEKMSEKETEKLLGDITGKQVKKDEPILVIPGNIDYTIEFMEDGTVGLNYGDNPQNKLCGLSMARDIIDYRLDVARKVEKDSPAWLAMPVRDHLGKAMNIIDQTIRAYAAALYKAEMEKKEEPKGVEKK